jgi:3'-phosphoadenosine 5'-phosphosulfate sulfotransferase (PAPS reductase)/FAD synthetase
VSSRNNRQPDSDMFPGMYDSLDKKPPKATDDSWKARTLEEAIERTYELLDKAIVQYSTGDALVEIKNGKNAGRTSNYGPRELAGIFGLYSGGNDSVVMQHVLRRYMQDRPLFRHFFQGTVHVNTGIAIDETTQHVREAIPAWGMNLLELHPRVNYLDLVLGNVIATTGPNAGVRAVWRGFPGPGGGKKPDAGKRKKPKAHNVMYMRLKDQPMQALRRQMVGNDGIRRKVMYVGGMRWDESDARFRNAEEVAQDKAIVWVAALVHWTNVHMREYRSRYRCQKVHKHQPHRMCSDDALPLNPVTEHIHMSGDCTCGAYAKPGEKEEIRFFYPEHAAKIDAWERVVRDAGIPACKWGQAPPKGFEQAGADEKSVLERMCVSCAPPDGDEPDFFDHMLERGLITDAQHAAFTQEAS